MNRHTAHSRHLHSRPGTAYVFFLGTATLVTVIGLSAMATMRIQWQAGEDTADAVAARFYARTAIELGFLRINADPDWRMDLGSGTWIDHEPINDHGIMTLQATIVSNMDGNSLNDPVVLTGIGEQGNARHKMTVRLVTLSDYGGLTIQAGSWQRAGGN